MRGHDRGDLNAAERNEERAEWLLQLDDHPVLGGRFDALDRAARRREDGGIFGANLQQRIFDVIRGEGFSVMPFGVIKLERIGQSVGRCGP